MNRKYRKILRKIDKSRKPCEFSGTEAMMAAELIEAGYATGGVARDSSGSVSNATATGLTFHGRCAMDESSVWFRVERVTDVLIGVVVGAASTALAHFFEWFFRWLGQLIESCFH